MRPASRSGRIVPAAAIACLGLVCLIGVLRAAVTLDLHIPFDVDEGWNAFHAAAAMAGTPLYPPPDSFFFNNYPPLSFYAVGGLGLLTHDNIFAGRLISLIALLATGFGIAATARTLGAGWKAGLFGALFFMAVLVFDTNYAGINDPQLLGHAFGMAGLWLALGDRRATGRIAAAALLLSLAVFTKHSLVAQPIALFLWLVLADRPAALRLAAAGLLFALVGAAAFQGLYHTSLLSQIARHRLYSLKDSWDGLTGWLMMCAVPLVAALAALVPARRDRTVLFCLIYLALSLAIGTWLEGGAGTSSNLFFDNLIALGLCAAIGLERLSNARRAPRLAMLFAASFVLPVAAMLALRAKSDGFDPRFWLDRRNPAILAAARDIALISAQHGPVLCADLSLCYWAGKTAELDEWGLNQAILTHRRDTGELESMIAAGRYAMIVVNPVYSAIWSPPVLRALGARYRLSHSDANGLFWARRQQ